MSEVANLKVRKDLSRWSRKLLLSIGLEDIGKHIVGEEKWKTLYPLWQAEADDKPPSDFDPNEVHEDEDHNGVQDGETAETMSQADPSETPPPSDEPEERKSELLENFFQNLLPYWYFFNRAFPNPGLLNNFSNNVSDEDLSSTNPAALMDTLDGGNQQLNSLILFESLKRQYVAQMGLPTGLQSFNQFPPNGPLYNSQLLEQMMAANGPNAKLDTPHEASARGVSSAGSNHDSDEGEQPLDLTQKRTSRTENGSHRLPVWPAEATSNNRPSPVDDLKSAKNLPRLSVRSGKGYTSHELEAALRDIQSGKLGTRRAAVIYGIPRSTLRNKVYKLGKDRSRPFLRQKPVFPSKSSESPPNPYSLAELAASDHQFDQKLSDAHKLDMDHSISSNPKSSGLLSCLRRDLEPSNVDENQAQNSEDEAANAKYDDEISHEKQVLKNWLRSRLSKQPGLDSQLLDGQYPCKRERDTSNNNNNHTSRHVPPLTDHMSDSSENSDLSSRQDSSKDVILKIPSVLNNQSSLNKAISLKKRKRESSLDDNEEQDGAADSPMPNSESYGLDHLPTSSILNSGLLFGSHLAWKGSKNFKADADHVEHNGISIKPTSKAANQKHEMFHQHWGFNKDSPPASMLSSTSSSSTGGQDSSGKKSRPKRGKYRNYDRDALLQAVKAVQNGEMSVHRAGSFYGVPHSTLEYKVKERHLLRRPKRKTAESPQLNHKSSPESSMSGSEPVGKNTSMSHQQLSDNKPNLPATPDIRDSINSINRYLNANNSGGGNLARALAGVERDTSLGTLSNATGKCSNDLPHSENNHSSYGLPRGPYLDMINLNDLIRKNLDPAALLDLTKKP